LGSAPRSERDDALPGAHAHQLAVAPQLGNAVAFGGMLER